VVRTTQRWQRGIAWMLSAVVPLAGCAAPRAAESPRVNEASAAYVAQRLGELDNDGAGARWVTDTRPTDVRLVHYQSAPGPASMGGDAAPAPTTQPMAIAAPAQAWPPAVTPDGYWRRNVWHQMGRESLSLAQRELWDGFRSTFWSVENMVVLTATMGASIAIRETGVDDTIRGRTKGHRQLGDADEPIQLLGHPGVHFGAAGVLWLGSTLTKDMETHEFSQALAQALAVNGLTTIALKVAANTRTPDDERFGWPSGHTSSAFTVAAVINEYYGPLAGLPSLALAGLVGYQRIDSRVHDFSDVVFGAMLGYIVGSSVARDNKVQFPEFLGMQVIPYSDPQTGATGLALFKSF